MKIYCVLFDTMPLLSNIVRIARQNGMEMLRQIGGCFTEISYVKMLTGKMPADLEPGGIGYRWHRRYKVADVIHWPWENELITHRFMEHGWDVRLHNNAYFTGLLSNDPAFIRTTSLPGGVKAEWKRWSEEVVGEIMLGDGSETETFYQKEAMHIHQIQSERPQKNTLYLIKHDQFHEAGGTSKKLIATSKAIELMRQWDFNEPDAVFWFFSDHGDWRGMGEHPHPSLFLTWVMFKDNTKNPIKVRSKFISIRDFFPTLMDKFGYPYEAIPDVRSIQQEQDRDRIYYVEDARLRFDERNSTTAIACRFTDWQGDKPSRLHQVSYFKLTDEYKSLVSNIDKDGFITNYAEVADIDPVMKQAVIDRFHWVSTSYNIPAINSPQPINIDAAPDALRQRYAQKLIERINQLEPATTVSSSKAEAKGVPYRNDIQQLILHEDIDDFLNWHPVVSTMFHEAKIEELEFLKSLPDWKRWENAIRESSIGNPKRYKAYPQSSGNLIHRAYSLAQLEQRSGCRIDHLTQIVEFGGGYGSMCRLAYQLGFKGRYIIYDLPEFVALQEYFLNCTGFEYQISFGNTSEEPTSIVLLSDFDKLAEQLNYKLQGQAFIATWSMSEAPIDIRNQVFELVSGADYYLIAYYKEFGEVNNSEYFSHIACSDKDYEWTNYPISHLPGHHYLIGRKKDSIAVKPSNDESEMPKSSSLIGGLIFSKDRPMQLRATIESFLLHCRDSEDVSLTVLYKASMPLYQYQYDDLKNCFSGITFIEEEDFKQQSLATIESSEYILFMVDDNIYTRDFSVREAVDLLQRETEAIGFSLRLGENTTYCYMAGTDQWQPEFESVTDYILKFDWTRAVHDYAIPLEVSSSIYRSQQIVDFLSGLDFENPNTMESQMLDENKQFKQTQPKLLCYRTSVTFCNPVNKVQQVYPQTRCGTDKKYTDERLAEVYQQGMVVDVSEYADFVSNAVHQETELYFRKVADDAIKISVIVPCYNQGRFLPEAIESLVNQTYKNWQCIIVNDGSSDNTVEVAEQLIAKYPDRDIRFIDKPHSGVSDTRNMGIEASTGEWILPLDSDDMFEPTFMQTAVDIVQQGEKIDIVFANMQEFGASDGQWIPAKYSQTQVVLEDTMPYASLYRKQLWRKVGGYDKLLSVIRQPEDWSFWISCSKHNPVVERISEKLFLYRVHPQSTYLRMIKPKRELSQALVATCHPDLYLVRILVQAWQVIANCPDDVYQRILGAIEMCPEYGLAYFWRGLRLMQQGRTHEAFEDYQRAVERAKKGDWQSLFALMMLQKNNGDLAGAHSSLEKLLTIRPDFDWARGMLPPRVVQQKILFYYDRIGNFNKTSPGGTVIAVLNFARALLSSNHNMEIHITGDLVYYPAQYKSLRIVPLPPPHEREQFLANYDVVFFATHIRYFKDLVKPAGQIWVLCQHCWEADDLVSLSHMSDFDIVVCLSELHKTQLRNRGIGDEKLLAIPNLVDTDVYSPKDDTERDNHSIMYAGALHEHKCLDVLMDALRLVRRQVQDAELHIYGDGNMWRGGSAYGDGIASTKPEGTYFHGYVDNKYMPLIYSRHSILCLTSKFESFGLVTVEAQACGCIPVVHNAGGVAVTLADGQTGFLYSPNTPEKLAETIIKAVRTVDTGPSIRQKAVDFARDNFGMTRAADYISKLWDRITIARAANTVRALLESNDIEQAGLECEQLLQKYPRQPDILLLQAMIMLQRADALKADAAIRKVFEKFPNHIRALNDYGLVLMKTGDIKKAAGYFGKAYKLNPCDKNTNINCYAVLKKSGRYAQAKTMLLNYLENVGEEAWMLQLLGEIDGLTRGQGSAVNLVSQQLLDDRQTVHRRDSVGEPLVTVIMPAYNSADYIAQAIESVLIQSYPKLELLIVDDGSTDNTREIILQNKDERIKYFHKENGGPSSARNLAINKASGQYIMPLDADDMMTPDFIAKHLQEFDKHPEADLVYCDVLLIDADGNPIRVMNKPEYQSRRNLIRDLFQCGHPVIPFRLGIKKSVFDKIGLYDETLMIAEDYDMMRRFVKVGLKAHHLREALHIRRMRSDSISITADADKTKNHFDVIRRFTDTFSGEELFPDIEWDKIPPQTRQLHAKCQAAATCLLLGQAYVKARSPVYAQTAFEQARSELDDCLKMDPANKQVQHLLQKCEDARAGHVEAVQQGVC